MRILLMMVMLMLISVGGCTKWNNPNLLPTDDKKAVFKADRKFCQNKAKKIAGSEPLNDLRRYKTYEQQQQEYSREVRAYQNCMSSKGWVKD